MFNIAAADGLAGSAPSASRQVLDDRRKDLLGALSPNFLGKGLKYRTDNPRLDLALLQER
jgi:hypothetical protein